MPAALATGKLVDSRMKVSCTFDPETFEQIRVLAEKQNVPFTEQVRQLVEFGLMDIEEGRQ